MFATDEIFTNDADLSDLKLVNKDAVILDVDQKAVDIDDVVLLDNQIAVSPDRVLPDGFKSIPDDSLLLNPNQLAIDNNQQVLQPDQKAVPMIQTVNQTILHLPGSKIHLQLSMLSQLKLGDDAPGVGTGDGDGAGAGSSNGSGSGVGVSMNSKLPNSLRVRETVMAMTNSVDRVLKGKVMDKLVMLPWVKIKLLQRNANVA